MQENHSQIVTTPFSFTIHLDLIVISESNDMHHGTVLFLPGELLSSEEEWKINKWIGEYNKFLENKRKEDQWLNDVAIQAKDHLLNTYGIENSEHTFSRFYVQPISHDTNICLMTRGNIEICVNFTQLLTKQTMIVRQGIKLTAIKTTTVGQAETLILVIGGCRRLLENTPPYNMIDEFCVYSTTEKRNLLNEMIDSPQAKYGVVQEMVALCTNKQEIEPILESIYTVSQKYMVYEGSVSRDLIDTQISLFDALISKYMAIIFLGESLPQDPESFDRVVIERHHLEAGSTNLLPFSLIDIKRFLNSDQRLLRYLLHGQTFLHWLLMNNINMKPDLNILVQGRSIEQELNSIHRIHLKNVFKKLMCSNKETKLIFLNKILSTYIPETNSTSKLDDMIVYLIKIDPQEISDLGEAIGDDEPGREALFNSITTLMMKISGTSISSRSVDLVKLFVVEGLLWEIHELIPNFFRFITMKRALLTVLLLRYYFSLPIIDKENKIMMFNSNLLTDKPEKMGEEASNFVAEMIKDPQYCSTSDDATTIRIADVFDEVDKLFPPESDEIKLIEKVIIGGKLTNFHQKCIIAYDQMKYMNNGIVDGCFTDSRLDLHHKALNKFIVNFANEAKMNYIISKNLPSQLQNTLEALNEQDYSPFKLKYLQMRSEAIQITEILYGASEFLEENRNFLSDYQFFIEIIPELQSLQYSYMKMTKHEILSTVAYKQALRFRQDHFKNFGQLTQEYPKFNSSLKENCINTKTCSLETFDEALLRTRQDFFSKFKKFENPKSFTLSEFDIYFSNYEIQREKYRNILKWFNMQESSIKAVFNNCEIIIMFKKILKLTEPLEKLSNGTIADLKPNSVFNKMKETKSKINTSDETKINVEMMISADSSKLVKNVEKQDPFIQKLPWLVLSISKSPDLVNFIKERESKFIKFMREEVDNENMEIVNRLGTVHNNISFIFKKGLEMDEAINGLAKLGYEELEKTAGFMNSLEGLVSTHITDLVDKTRKDKGYNKKMIKRLLSKCLYVFSYLSDQNEYGLSAKTNHDSIYLSISVSELQELFNKSMIMVTEKGTSSSSTEQDEALKKEQQFSEIGKVLIQIKGILMLMRQLGILYKDFSNIKYILPELEKESPEVQGGSHLSIPYNEKTGIDPIIRLKDSLKGISTAFDRQLRYFMRPDCYLLTHFSGKTLHYLMGILCGTVQEDIIVQECLNLIREAHPKEGVEKVNFKSFINKLYSNKTPEEKLKYTHTVLQEWTSEIVRKRNNLTRPEGTFFSFGKVLVSQECPNMLLKILKILKDSGVQNVTLSQFLFCSKSTTPYAVHSFTKKALYDKFYRPYFLININKTGYSGVSEFRKIIESLSEEELAESNTRILAFIQTDPLSRSLLEIDLFADAAPFLKSIMDKVDDGSVRDMFSRGLSKLEIVTSEMSGMGKSTYIKSKVAGLDPVDLFFAGELTQKSLNNRLHILSSNFESKYAVTIKLDFIEEFQTTCDLVDYTLLCICLLGKVNTHSGCCMFNPERVIIEIGNTFSSELFGGLGILQFIANSDSSSKVSTIHRVSDFKVESILFDQDPNSREYAVGKYLSSHDRSFGGLNKNSFHSLIQKHMVDRINSLPDPAPLTYSKYQYWLKTMFQLGPGIDKKIPDGNDGASLRTEVFEELLDFASRVVGLSAKNVRTSQEMMIKLVSSVEKDRLRSEAVEQQRNSIMSLLNTWNPEDLIVPLEFEGRLLLGALGLEVFKESTRRHGKRINLKKYGLKEKQFVDPLNIELSSHTEEYLTRLCKVTGKDLSIVNRNSLTFRGVGFSLTAETYLKICLILSKASLAVPIILMGESGCGKTHLAHFVAEGLLQEKMFSLTLYSGVTEKELVEFMKKVVGQARSDTSSRVWVLFDEFNTSPLQILVSELMLDRECPVDASIRQIPDNIVFIACCNPYRLKARFTGTGLSSKAASSLLSHRVYPIPERLIDYVWDFGQLPKADEKAILKGIVKSEKIFSESKMQDEENFCEVIYKCHSFVREKEDRSAVSLRDIKRVMKLYRWFIDVLRHSLTASESESKVKEGEISDWAFVGSIMICYGLRLNGRPEQPDFIRNLSTNISQLSNVKKYSPDDVTRILPRIADLFFDCLKKEGTGIIPPGTAINKPLKENFIAMLASVDTLTPMIICGAPGTSKTLSTHLLSSTLVPHMLKKHPMLGFIKKGVNQIYYGGSESSTSEGISLVFRRGEKFLEEGGEDTPVVVFDEIGLAEIAPANPLKVLHPLLEQQDAKVGFIGLSNWTLDLSKMNRLIYIARPDLDLSDLKDVFKAPIGSNLDSELNRILSKQLEILAEVYLKYRVWQKAHGLHKDFHGSRDVYSVAKYLQYALKRLQDRTTLPIEGDIVNKPTNLQAEKIVQLAIERNFGGEYYSFGETESDMGGDRAVISFESVPNLIQMKHLGAKPTTELDGTLLSGSLYAASGSIWNNPSTEMDNQKQILRFNSSTVFKAFFQAHQTKQTVSADFLSTLNVFSLITSSLLDDSSRYLLVRSEGQLLENILIDTLHKEVRDAKIVDWRGVAGKESIYELFSSVKSYISLGYFLVMKGLDELYGSLYDLFNHNFTEISGQKYCYLYFGESKHRVEVHPHFRCMIFIDADYGSDEDVELRLPAPFLNRFEKYIIQLKDVFPGDRLNDLRAVKSMAQKLAGGHSSRVVSLTMDMVASICICSEKDYGDVEQDENTIVNSTTRQSDLRALALRYKNEMKMIMRLATLNILQNRNLTEEDLSILKNEHLSVSLRDILRDFSKPGHKKLCLFTFSNPVELDALQDQLEKEFKIRISKSAEFYEAGLESRSRMVREHKSDLFFLQFSLQEHLSLVPQIKACLSENKEIKKAIFLVHLDRVSTQRDSYSGEGLNFWDGWNNLVLEDIRQTNYSKAVETRHKSLEELVLSEENGLGRLVLKEVVIASYQRIAQENKGKDLKSYIQPIRRMLDLDSDELFISELRQKIRELIIIDDSKSWLSLVSEKNQNNKDYVDMEKDIFMLYMQTYGEKTKKLVHNMSVGVKGFPGYHNGILSKDRVIASKYKAKLKELLDNLRISARDLEGKVKEVSFLKVPFLGDIYSDLEDEIIRNLLSPNIDTLKNLSDNHRKLAIILSREPKTQSNSQEANKIQALIQKGEEFFAEKCEQSVGPFIKRIEEVVEDLSKVPKLNEFIIEDILGRLLKLKGLNKDHSLIEPIIMYQFCRVAVLNKNKTEPTLVEMVSAALYLLGTSLDDVKLSLETLVNARVQPEKIKQAAEELMKKPSQHAGSTLFDLPRIGKMLASVQTSLIPNLDGVDLPDLRYRLESTAISFRNQKNLQVDKNIDRVFQGLAITLGLIEIIPESFRLTHVKELESIRQNKEAYGDQMDYTSISKVIESLLFEHTTRFQNNDKLRLLLGEYLRLNAQSNDYKYFMSEQFDETVAKANMPNLLYSLTSVVARVVSLEFPPFWSFEQFSELIDNYSSTPRLVEIDSFLTGLRVSKDKSMYLIVHLIDQLTLRSAAEPIKSQHSEEDSLVQTLKLLKEKLPTFTNFHGLKGVISMTILRKFMTRNILENLPNNKQLCGRLEETMLNIVNTKDEFFLKQTACLPIYLLQGANIISDHFEPLAAQMQTIRILIDIIGEAGDTDLIVATMDSDLNKHSIKLGDQLHADISKDDINSFIGLFNNPQYQGSVTFQRYASCMAILNRFLTIRSTKYETNILENQQRQYLNAIGKCGLPNDLHFALSSIIADNLENLGSLMDPKEANPKSVLKLKKTIAHILIGMSISPSFGMSLEKDKILKPQGISNDNLLARLAVSEDLSNFISVFSIVIKDRIGSGNLGIYQCSCSFVYNIMNCGFAMEKRKCPKCAKEIGGMDHKFVSREGHKHIKTLDEFFNLIVTEVKKHESIYKVHPLLSASSTEMIANGLKVLGQKTFVDSRANLDSPNIINHQKTTIICHLIDHIILYVLPSMMPPSEKNGILRKYESSLNLGSKDNMEIVGKVNNQHITDPLDYFANHIRNDIEQLKQISKINNISETLDFVNAALSTSIINGIKNEKSQGSRGTESIRLYMDGSAVEHTTVILKNLEKIKGEQMENHFNQNKLIKNTIQKKADFKQVAESVKRGPDREPADKSTLMGNIYPLMRHTSFKKEDILETFKTKLDNSQFSFLRSIVNYQEVLKDFPRMVMANLDLTIYLNQNYNRVFSFDESTKIDLLSIQDPYLQTKFNEFKTVWNSVIPKHEDTHPEVFSFAYMCNQNLNVANYIERTLAPGGSKLINFLMVDSNEEFSGSDTQYMKGIVRTFLEGFHNKLIGQAKKVLGLEEALARTRLGMEFVTKEDLVSDIHFEDIVMNNVWVCPDFTKSTEINFNFEFIEYTIARAFLKTEINCEDVSIKHYNFKNSRITESEQLVNRLSTQFEQIPLTKDIILTIEDLSSEQVESSLKFILEIGEYISQNFLFDEPELLLSDLLKKNNNAQLGRRFEQFNISKHGKLKVGQVSEYFSLVKEKDFNLKLNQEKKTYNKPIPQSTFENMIGELKAFDGEKLKDLKKELKDQVRTGFYNKGFPDIIIGDLFDISDVVGQEVPALEELPFGSYFGIVEAIDEVIEKKKY